MSLGELCHLLLEIILKRATFSQKLNFPMRNVCARCLSLLPISGVAYKFAVKACIWKRVSVSVTYGQTDQGFWDKSGNVCNDFVVSN